MTDFVRGKNQHKIISEKKDDDELVSTKRLNPKRSNFSDKNNSIKKKQKTSKTTSAIIKDEDEIVSSDNENENTTVSIEEEKDRNLFSSVYHTLKNKKKSKLTNKIEKLTPTQLKEYLNEPSNVLNKKEEADAKKLLPFLKKNIPKSACRLFKKDIHKGMVVLGSFESVSEIDITISLPFGLKGYIKFNEISDSFTEWMKKTLEREEENVKSTNFRKMKIISDQVRKMFYKGQIIKVAIAGFTDHHTIEGLHCSMRPEVVNSGSSMETFTENMTIHGAVQSIEDKGYIVSFGSKDYTGFIEFSNTNYYYPGQTDEKQNDLFVGQPIEALIDSIDKDTKTFKLTLSHSLVSRATVKDSSVITMDSIKAGMLVETKVIAVIGGGLHLGFLDFFAGDVELLHLNNPLDNYKDNQNVKARIIFVDQVNKRIGLSTLPHIMGYKPYPFGTFKKGQIFDFNSLTVERIEPLEMILACPSTVVSSKPQTIKGYVHIEELESGVVNLNKASNQFKKGEAFNKKCRIKHLDYLDGMVTFTARTRELEKKFFSYNDIECGMITTGIIKYIREESVEIELAPSIHGVVPKTHLADVAITNTSTFFKLGSTVKVRVISVDPDKKRLQLTLKKSLIQSEYPIITDKNTTPAGLISHGIITKTTRYLVFVSFYNNSFGVVESQNLSLTPIQSVQKQFPIGRTVLVKSLSSDNSKPGLSLTMIIDDKDFESQQKILINNNLNNKQVDQQEEEEQEEQEEEQQEEQVEEEQQEEVEQEEQEEEKVAEEKVKKVEPKNKKDKQNTNNKKVEKSKVNNVKSTPKPKTNKKK
ncbi:hypothetical protein DICPUDRAFT_29294 [Dictyostelium purpureum]|uniref:S1 motif domain-containing protein n=1 Tax=Dictyostelium purpureum TaxID=5786 RepID=F0ZDF8_DICPU|nr:uncharacterized protein DICPUDRAFT_29294 [Dictyostelium purpureum]EGC38037.1 hypothetical protein DICPUDRAFT_29294 [Dictyostelium purpureum]|eukprot:XP_003285438.1 hypothetical protein DICPUDRAFT_29294 [Dictyostelium purpureum]